MIRIEHVTRNYGELTAVSDVSLSIERGEIVGLLGHNGAGKTTLMKMITGFLEPTSGTINVGGSDVVDDRLAVQRQLGYLPENAPLYPEMEVKEYLLMMANLREVPADRRDRAVQVALERTGLMGHVARPIGQLSKGYRQRVGLAQAIVHEPNLLVLDEPTNGLDPVQIQSIRELIQQLGRDATIILSTHIMQEVEAVCDRVLVMIDGKLSADSALSDMLTSHTLRMSVEEGANVVSVLSKLDGIEAVREIGVDPTNEKSTLYAVDHDEDVSPGPRVLEAAQKANWTVHWMSPEQLTLENVFRTLQQQHIARQEVSA
ncbi:MAG: ATP-binding cassette domain-containing protein [Myxococcota bacterium]